MRDFILKKEAINITDIISLTLTAALNKEGIS